MGGGGISTSLKTVNNIEPDGDGNITIEMYPVGSFFISSKESNPGQLFGGAWEFVEKIVNTNGWYDYSYTNPDYIGTTQSSYTPNKWCVVNNVLFLTIGVGATATINTGTETEVARIPIKGTPFSSSANRVWNGAVGGAGSYGGFVLLQNTDYISIYIKPHTTANGQTAPWFSSHFSIPLGDGIITDSTLFTEQFKYKRIS